MCGIAGLAGTRVSPDDALLVQHMCRAIAHRGPDDSGLHVGAGVLLGHSRLSILDLEGGHQPISNEDGTVWVTFNGEIYNYRELMLRLIQLGHRFSTQSDTEVIVHLYEEHGIELVRELNGMFAFALWDAPGNRLYLVRDRLGIKPLYYSVLPGRVVFGSEMKAVLVCSDVPKEIDREAIAEYVTLGYINDPRSPFASIRKVGSGCYLECREGRIQETRYWRVPLRAPSPPGSEDELCEELRYLIEDATRLQLRADVPVGIFASGGIDSTAIMWAAAQQGSSVEAFLCEFDALQADTPYARLAARATGMRLHENQLSAVDAGRLLPRLVWYADEPIADPAIIPCYLIAKEAVSQVKVILNGTGGDEVFGGYPRYNLRGLLPPRWSAAASRLICKIGADHSWARRFGAALDYRERLFRRMTIFPEHEIRAALGLDRAAPVRQSVGRLFRESARNDRAGSMMFVDLHTYLPADLFMMLDRMSMAVSLEARVPLTDHRLVEFAARLPGDLRMRGGDLKWLLRRALRGHVPDQILDRAKQGFGPPVASWMRGALGGAARRLLTKPDSRVRQLFAPSWIDSRTGRVGGRGDQVPQQEWTLLILELWWRTFVDRCDLSNVTIDDLASGAVA
jgi:asparagine synthase (glutamine-hydrolysing)